LQIMAALRCAEAEGPRMLEIEKSDPLAADKSTTSDILRNRISRTRRVYRRILGVTQERVPGKFQFFLFVPLRRAIYIYI